MFHDERTYFKYGNPPKLDIKGRAGFGLTPSGHISHDGFATMPKQIVDTFAYEEESFSRDKVISQKWLRFTEVTSFFVPYVSFVWN